jgi:Mrp family chromosome partitioning ATPase
VRRWPLVLLVALVAGGGALAAVASRSARYESTAKLLLAPLPQYDQTFFGTSLLRDAGDPKLTASTAAELLHSHRMAVAAARRLGDGTLAGSVLDAVRVVPAGETNVLRVTARADGGDRAERVAEAFAESVVAARWSTISSQLDRRISILTARRAAATRSAAASITDQLQALQAAREAGSDPTVQLAQRATRAEAASQTPAALVLVLALIGGAFLGALAAIGIDRIRGRVSDEEDVLAIYPLPVWARVPAAPRRQGANGPILFSAMSAVGRNAFRALAAHVANWAPEGGTIAVISSSDADGRTTAAASIAAALAERGHRATLVRLGEPAEEALQADLEASGVTVVAPKGPDPRAIADLVQEARERADIVVIDGPSVRSGTEVIGAATSADIVLVARVGHTPRHQLRQAREMLEGIGARPAGLVLMGTGGRRRSRQARETNPRATADEPTPLPRSALTARDASGQQA